MSHVVIILTEDSIGVEDLPDDLIVEIHDYREGEQYPNSPNIAAGGIDPQGRGYTIYSFGGSRW